MKHKTIVDACESLGLPVIQVTANGHRSFSATNALGARVYWSTSFEGGLLGLPRVITNGHDTHARSIREILYLVEKHMKPDLRDISTPSVM